MPIANALDDAKAPDSLASQASVLPGAFHAWGWAQGVVPSDAWRQWACDTAAWLSAQGVAPRDAWVVLPVGAVLSQARQAWAQAVGGWMPRIDTIAGLVDALGWAHVPPPWNGSLAEAFAGPVTLDSVLDRLQARSSLGMQPWAKQWARRDPRGFDFALDQVVDAAQTWLRALQACSPEARGERVAAWREALSADSAQGPGGPGHREALLMAWALEWAAASAQQGLASDIVFACPCAGPSAPAAWVAVSAGETVAPGSEGALTQAALAHAAAQGTPVLRVLALPGDVQGGAVSMLACADALDEARQAAAAVLLAVNAARQRAAATTAEGVPAAPPVALIALDRSVVRHTRALLEDAGVSLADETGWRLSTTRAATTVSRLLSASNPRASTDELLDWLKSGWLHWPAAHDGEEPSAVQRDGVALAEAVGQLEGWCRRHGLVSAWGLGDLMGDASAIARSLPPAAAAVWHWARAAVAPLQSLWRDRQAHLSDWLLGLNQALAASGAKQSLQGDEAGQLAWSALRLDEFSDEATSGGKVTGWHAVCQHTPMDGSAMQRWVREVLEDVTFRPAAPEGRPDVVITTLARAVLRPFDAIVMPGADERQLGALPSASGWLGQHMRETMGLSTAVQLRQAQWEAFQLVLTQPRVTCLYRKAQGSEPLEASPWLARWAQSQTTPAAEASLVLADDPRPLKSVPITPTERPLPSLQGSPVGLPVRVSATTYEQLRQCPYRFFAVTVLGLRQADELQEGVEASEYGTWLHEVLRRFHEARYENLALSHADEDVAQWLAVAHEVSIDLGMDSEGQRAHFLPFAAALPAMARAYVKWMRQHEADGWSVRATEASITRALPLDDGSTLPLYGQLDRIDVRHEPHADGGPRHEVRWVLDYKTGNATKLSQRAHAGSEDTQLAFYAALGADDDVLQGDAVGIRAGYVHLDPKAVKVLEHADVAESAQALLQGLASDWQRLRNGSPLPALGEGAACGHCHARGLCRRDHWSGESA